MHRLSIFFHHIICDIHNIINRSDSTSGTDAVELLGLHDVVFEYEITSNRVDCYSVLGIAREAAVTFHKEFVSPVIKMTGNASQIIKMFSSKFLICPSNV